MSSNDIRILIIDDDPGDFQMTRAMIESVERPTSAYSVEWASSWQEAEEAFRERTHDLYFVDYFLEDRDGLAVVREARELGVREPLIMLTGRGSRDVDLEAMEAGASDYLVKGSIDPELLERTIRYAIERHRTRQALLDSEERHRGMFDHLPVGLYRCSPDGSFMDANPALVRLLGHPDAESLAKRYSTSLYVAPEDHDRFKEALESYGVVRGFSTALERTDGTSVQVRNTARAHRGPSGDIDYVEGVVENVTQLESAERLRGGAARFDAVYDHARMPMALVDEEGRIIEGNPALRRALDYSGEELSGTPLADLGTSADHPALERLIMGVARGQVDRVQGEHQLIAGDGTVLWTRLQAIRVADTDGGGACVLVLLEEVAEAG